MSSFKYLSTLFLIISIIQLASNARLKEYRQSIGNMTRDQEFLINTSPKFYCTLNEARTSRNCSDMLVMFKNAKLESTCINSTTLEFTIKNATAANSGEYHCYLHPRLFIRAATYNFGTKPKNVTNFKCISKGFQNLTCTWKPVPNKVKTTYIIGASFGMPITTGFWRRMVLSCPFSTMKRKSCVWGLSTLPPYYRGMNDIHILLTGSNRFGNNVQIFSFKQAEIIEAGAPLNFNYSEVAENYVSLNWTHPRDMHPCLTPPMYEITYKSRFDHNSTVFNEPPKNEKDCGNSNIEYETRLDLIPNIVYDIGIRCRVIQSKNLWSQRVNLSVKTREALPYFEPTIIPQSFMVTNIKPRLITLYWLGIEEKHCNAKKCGYCIRVYHTNLETRKKRDLQYEKISIEGFNNTYFVFTDHREDTDYEFVIYTENEKGLSSNSTSIKVPSIDKLPQKPKNLFATSSNTSGYTVEWDVPDNDGSKVDSYTVFWCLNNKPRPDPCKGTINWLAKPVPNDQRSVQLALPDNGFIYQFAVAANSGNLSSGLEWVPCIVPVDRVLDKIRRVSVTPEGPHKFRVFWSLDCSGQANTVKNYTIRVRYCSNSCMISLNYCNKLYESRVVNQSTETQVILDGFKPYSYYLISVGATTVNGINEFSLEKCQRNHPGAPSPPRNIRYKKVTSHSAVVEWDMPQELNGPLDKYIIFVNRTTKVDTVSNTRTLSYTLRDLTSYVNHSITVEACNGNLCSNDSNSVEILTNVSRPGSLKMLPYSVNNTSPVIHWESPSRPNGPIDYYLLHIRPENDTNVSTSEILKISGERLNTTLDLPCDPDDPTRPFMVSIQAVNVVDNDELYGPMSDLQKVECIAPKEGLSRLTIGLIVGLVVGFGILIVILYTLVNWMKGKVKKMRNITADLAEGLNSPQSKLSSSYENFKNGLFNNLYLSPKPAYGRLDSFVSEDSFKNRNGSDTSQFSATSTYELIVKKTIVAEKTKRNPSGDSGGCCSTGGHDSLSSSLTHHTCNLSSDSGNEADLKNPPSPEAARDAETKDLSKHEEKHMDVSRVSGSKDSGVDKGDDSDEKSKSPVSRYSQFSSYVDKALGSCSPQAPYNKFGMEQSCYVPYSRGRNMNLYGQNLPNSEPSINEMKVGNHYSCLGAEQLARNILDSTPASQYSKLGLSRSIQDVLGWRKYSSVDGGEGAKMKNSQGIVLPYSRFGIRRVESPTAKNNPYITVGMAFSMVDKDPHEILKQKLQEQVPCLPDISALSKNPLPSKPSLAMDEGKVPVIDVQPKDQAYSIFGMGEADVANKNMDLAVKPFLVPITRPDEGYINFDDLKIKPISKMVADAKNISLNDAETDDLDKSRDYGYDTMMASDSHSSDGIAPNSFLPLSLKDSVEDNPELSLTLSDNIYLPPSNEDSKKIVSPAKMPSSSAGPIPTGNGYVSAEAMACCANLENDRTLKSNSTSKNHELLPTKTSPELKETDKLPDVNVKRSNGYVTLGDLPSICGGGQEIVRYNMPITNV